MPPTQVSPQSQSLLPWQFLTQNPLVQSSPDLQPPEFLLRLKKLENLFRVLLIEVEPAPHLRLFEKQLAKGSPVPPAGHEH